MKAVSLKIFSLALACVLLCCAIPSCVRHDVKPSSPLPDAEQSAFETADTSEPTETPDAELRQTAEPDEASEGGATEPPRQTAAHSIKTPAPTPSKAPTEAPTATMAVTAAPTATPAAAPTAAPTDAHTPAFSDQGSVPIGTASKPARFTMPTELYGVSVQDAESWFSDAVFVGDSITLAWKTYNNERLEKDPNFFGQTRFLCEGSYGVYHALEPVSSESMHPLYAGEQHYIWESARLMGAKKVFLLFGLNDLAILGVDGTADAFSRVLDNFRSSIPDVQLYVISAMYMYRGSEKPKLNNRNLYLLNQRLVTLCAQKNCEFVNIASHLIDENGFLPDVYTCDQYVHQTDAAYDIWAQILRSLAARHILGIPPVTFSLPNG